MVVTMRVTAARDYSLAVSRNVSCWRMFLIMLDTGAPAPWPYRVSRVLRFRMIRVSGSALQLRVMTLGRLGCNGTML